MSRVRRINTGRVLDGGELIQLVHLDVGTDDLQYVGNRAVDRRDRRSPLLEPARRIRVFVVILDLVNGPGIRIVIPVGTDQLSEAPVPFAAQQAVLRAELEFLDEPELVGVFGSRPLTLISRSACRSDTRGRTASSPSRS